MPPPPKEKLPTKSDLAGSLMTVADRVNENTETTVREGEKNREESEKTREEMRILASEIHAALEIFNAERVYREMRDKLDQDNREKLESWFKTQLSEVIHDKVASDSAAVKVKRNQSVLDADVARKKKIADANAKRAREDAEAAADLEKKKCDAAARRDFWTKAGLITLAAFEGLIIIGLEVLK